MRTVDQETRMKLQHVLYTRGNDFTAAASSVATAVVVCAAAGKPVDDADAARLETWARERVS